MSNERLGPIELTREEFDAVPEWKHRFWKSMPKPSEGKCKMQGSSGAWFYSQWHSITEDERWHEWRQIIIKEIE